MTALIDLRPGYEAGDGSMDGAQLVDGEWWHPERKKEGWIWPVPNRTSRGRVHNLLQTPKSHIVGVGMDTTRPGLCPLYL
jgi:hypothetical protein